MKIRTPARAKWKLSDQVQSSTAVSRKKSAPPAVSSCCCCRVRERRVCAHRAEPRAHAAVRGAGERAAAVAPPCGHLRAARGARRAAAARRARYAALLRTRAEEGDRRRRSTDSTLNHAGRVLVQL